LASNEPPNSEILLKKYIQEGGLGQNPPKETKKVETKRKQPPKNTYIEAYHIGPSKNPPIGQTVKINNQTSPWVISSAKKLIKV